MARGDLQDMHLQPPTPQQAPEFWNGAKSTDLPERVNFGHKHPNKLADVFYCVFGCTDQPQKISPW